MLPPLPPSIHRTFLVMNTRSLLLLLFLALPAPLLRATEVDWGSIFGDGQMYTSSGNLLNNSYTFELGVWANGFTPTASNVSLWAANWEVISVAAAPFSNGWNSLDASDPNVNNPSFNNQYFSQRAFFNADGTVTGAGSTVFTPGQQVYIWAFNTQAVTPGTEWALVTSLTSTSSSDSVWQVPQIDSTGLAFPLAWSLDNADTAVFGSVYGTSGAGVQNVDPGPGNTLQTYSLSAVPEPGSAVMILVAGLLLRLRRKPRSA